MIDKTMLGLERVLVQQAVIERDHAIEDAHGAKGAPDWRPLSPQPCFMWWGTGAQITRMGGLQVRPEGTIDLERGGMLLEEGADVSARDRIGQVLGEDGNVLAAGLVILACAAFEGLTELTFRKVS